MKAILGIFCVVTVLVLAGDLARPAQDNKKDKSDLQGIWKLVRFERNGEENEFPANLPRWVIDGKTVRYAGETLATLSVLSDAKPRGLDLAWAKPKREYEAIYAIDGDTLKICLNRGADGVKERPTDFETKDNAGRYLFVFERQKPGSGDGLKEAPGYVGIQIAVDKDKERVIIAGTLKNSPAEKAGLKKDDAILKIGDTEATDLKTVVDRVRQARPATDLTIRVDRDGKEQDVTIRVGVLPFFLLDFE